MEAQAGGLCAETLAAYREHDEAMINVFTSAWLSTTAGIGAACQGGGSR